MFVIALSSRMLILQELAPYRMYSGRLPGVIGPVPQPSLDKCWIWNSLLSKNVDWFI
jgi:hypothetical protein